MKAVVVVCLLIILNRVYVLESSPDLQSWSALTPPVPGTAGLMELVDTNPTAGQRFYRVTQPLVL